MRMLHLRREEAQQRVLEERARMATELEVQVEERTAELAAARDEVVEAARLRERVEEMLLHDLKSPLGSMSWSPP
jgi:C4-dicarboxylate-specific signal transduction histidine kinase